MSILTTYNVVQVANSNAVTIIIYISVSSLEEEGSYHINVHVIFPVHIVYVTAVIINDVAYRLEETNVVIDRKINKSAAVVDPVVGKSRLVAETRWL